MSLHEEVIQMLLRGYAQTPTEATAAEEIRTLRARVAQLEQQLTDGQRSAEVKRPRK